MPMGGAELLILLVIVLLFFGAKRIPELARSLGVGARELKKASSDDVYENEAKELDKAEAREHREKSRPIQQAEARQGEQNVRAEPNSEA